MMEKEQKGHKRSGASEAADFLLQWGERKRVRCMKLKKDQNVANKSSADGFPKKQNSSSVAFSDREFSSPQRNHRHNKDLDSTVDNRRLLVTSPEKEDRYYTTRGSLGVDEHAKVLMNSVRENRRFVWPKLSIPLSNKEKEEDFMAMKGCKPSQRPKKRSKTIQKSLLFVSPGAWLSDLCQERYEVREKKTSKKRPRGLKAMGSIETDSD